MVGAEGQVGSMEEGECGGSSGGGVGVGEEGNDGEGDGKELSEKEGSAKKKRAEMWNKKVGHPNYWELDEILKKEKTKAKELHAAFSVQLFDAMAEFLGDWVGTHRSGSPASSHIALPGLSYAVNSIVVDGLLLIVEPQWHLLSGQQSSTIALMSGSAPVLFPGQCTPVTLFVFLEDSPNSTATMGGSITAAHTNDATDSTGLPSGSQTGSVHILWQELLSKPSNSTSAPAWPGSKPELGLRKKMQSSTEAQISFF
ncbi:unnamed protein product [Sphagnum balticum]